MFVSVTVQFQLKTFQLRVIKTHRFFKSKVIIKRNIHIFGIFLFSIYSFFYASRLGIYNLFYLLKTMVIFKLDFYKIIFASNIDIKGVKYISNLYKYRSVKI